MTKKTPFVIILFLILSACSTDKNMKSQDLGRSVDENFKLIGDFDDNKTIFKTDTFELSDHSTDGGQLIAFHTKDRDYIVIDTWLYGETGKLHVTFWTDRKVNLIIAHKTTYEYDRPYYENGYQITETQEYYSFTGQGFKYYNYNKEEINEFEKEKEKEIKDLLIDLLRGIEIVK